MKRRTRLGRIPSMKQEPTDDTLGALFGPHMHDSSQEVLALLRKLEWRGDNVNHHGYRGFCPSCGNDQATGHRTDCELNKVLTGPGPRIAGHLVEQNQRLARELAEAQKQNAALQEHNTKVLKRENLTKLDLADVLTWAKEMHQMARNGLTILAGHLEKLERIHKQTKKALEPLPARSPGVVQFMGKTPVEWEDILDYARAHGYPLTKTKE